MSAILKPLAAPPEAVTWNGLAAVRAAVPGKEVLAAVQGDVVFTLVASGPGAHPLFNAVLPGVAITDPL